MLFRSIKRPLSLKLDAALNVYTGKIENFNSDLLMNILTVQVSFGQRYNRITDVNTYVAGIGLHPFKPLYLEGKIWYDVQESEVQELALILKYMSQCWGIGLEFINRPDEFNVLVRVELKGLTGPLKF